MPRACIALRLRARLCRFATATTEGVVNGAAGVEERKVRRLTAGGNRIRTRGPMSGGEPARTNELSSHHNCGGRSELSPNLMRDERLQFLPQHRLDPG